MEGVSRSSFRLNRFSYFVELAKQTPGRQPLRILDLGGEEAYWGDKIDLLNRPVSITLLNTFESKPSRGDIISVKGDARRMVEFEDGSFDIVHSNSVIEHVGRWDDMRSMAKEISRLAPSYFVQTPYFWFPVEPHFRAIGFHWLPESTRAKIILSRKLGFVPKSSSIDEAMSVVQGSVLLDASMMKSLFPDAQITFEKWYGLPKSLMAIKAGA